MVNKLCKVIRRFGVCSLCLALVCCQGKGDALERALVLAGDNRAELERVLEFYRDDSLKLDAAKFLITNMPGHYSYADKRVDKYYDEVDAALLKKRGCSEQELVDTLKQIWLRQGGGFKKVFDVKIVKADFLIANIEEAFRQWKEGEWATHVSYQEFREFMLPYKVEELQPLDGWRSYLKGLFSKGLDKLPYCCMYRNSALWATCCLNDNMRDSLKPDIFLYHMEPIHRLDTKMRMPLGICQDYVEIAAAVLRSEGIPAVVDFTPQWPFRHQGHSWNALLANSGKVIPFGGVESNPGQPHKLDEKMAKVYRKTYAVNPEIEELLRREAYVPDALRNLFMRDVTNEYMVTEDVEVEVPGVKGGYAYLAVFNNKTWAPVAYGEVKRGKALFKDMGRNILYMPMAYKGDKLAAVGAPFVLTSNGEVHKVVADKTEKRDLLLYRKYPVFPHVQLSAHRIVGGMFQAANRADFADVVTVHKIKKWGVNGEEVFLPPTQKAYRYWRYYQPCADWHSNIAELAFIDRASHREAKGKVLGTEGSYGNNPQTCKQAAFDGDLLTYFDAPEGGNAWVGMDFGCPVDIEKIIYTPRGDGNTIGIGDEYELFYWDADRWNSLGKQTAETVRLLFKDVPADGLFLLRNLSRGVEERIFCYKDGEQVFW